LPFATTLLDRAFDYQHDGVRRPLRHLADHTEPMTHTSYYIGVGTSSIDLARLPEPFEPGRWEWPWQGLAQLADGTRLVLRGANSLDPPRIASTHTLAEDDGPINVLDSISPFRAWTWIHPHPADPHRPDPDRSHDPQLAAQQQALAALHQPIAATETLHRLTTRTTRRTT
jgi:hypothetical protein